MISDKTYFSQVCTLIWLPYLWRLVYALEQKYKFLSMLVMRALVGNTPFGVTDSGPYVSIAEGATKTTRSCWSEVQMSNLCTDVATSEGTTVLLWDCAPNLDPQLYWVHEFYLLLVCSWTLCPNKLSGLWESEVLLMIESSFLSSFYYVYTQTLDKSSLGPLRKAYCHSLNLLLRREVGLSVFFTALPCLWRYNICCLQSHIQVVACY